MAFFLEKGQSEGSDHYLCLLPQPDQAPCSPGYSREGHVCDFVKLQLSIGLLWPKNELTFYHTISLSDPE